MIIKLPQKPTVSIGQQVVRGLCAGCGVLVLIQLYFLLTFHYRHPVEMDKLYGATNEVLFISGFALLIASLAICISRPMLAAFGVLVALVTILAAFFTPLNAVRA